MQASIIYKLIKFHEHHLGLMSTLNTNYKNHNFIPPPPPPPPPKNKKNTKKKKNKNFKFFFVKKNWGGGGGGGGGEQTFWAQITLCLFFKICFNDFRNLGNSKKKLILH